MPEFSVEYDKAKLDAVAAASEEQAAGFILRVGEAIGASILQVQNRAKYYAPVLTGTLRRSITSDIDFTEPAGFVGSNLPYARIQEFGGVAGRNHTAVIGGYLYLSTAVRESRDYINRQFQKYLAIKKLT